MAKEQAEEIATAITSPQTDAVEDDAWYDLTGRKLQGKPTWKGVFIHLGKKVAIN